MAAGNQSNNKFFKEPNGLGLNLWFQTDPFTFQGNTWTDNSQKIKQYSYSQNDTGKPVIIESRFAGKNSKISEFVASPLLSADDNAVNKTSLTEIIDYLQQWKSTYVEYADFAYLKDLGVYPTNRLIIARRYPSPVGNNPFAAQSEPMATIVSYVPDNGDFISIKFGEAWEVIEKPSLTEVLNDAGKENVLLRGLAAGARKGFNVMTLGGFSEALQIKILEAAGIIEPGSYDYNNPPSGNPNLIKDAMQRSLVSKDTHGAGLSGKFQVKVSTEYELKYINGVEPGIVYLDIIQKALIFGTSKSVFIMGDGYQQAATNFMKNIISGEPGKVWDGMLDLVTKLGEAMIEVAGDFFDRGSIDPNRTTDSQSGNIGSGTGPNQSFFQKLTRYTIGTVISKYRVRLLATIHALTGAPSGYWHVTIGNPKRPIFSSGDMICSGVTLTFGKVLGFNDLPSTIKIDFDLTSARDLGGQEIFDRLNTGRGRDYFQWKRSYLETTLSGNFGADSPFYGSGGTGSDVRGAGGSFSNDVAGKYTRWVQYQNDNFTNQINLENGNK
jgi:hypothetical protein